MTRSHNFQEIENEGKVRDKTLKQNYFKNYFLVTLYRGISTHPGSGYKASGSPFRCIMTITLVIAGWSHNNPV